MFIAPRPTGGGGGEGGLVLFWSSTIDVTMEGFSKNYIDAIINKNKENEWRFIRILWQTKDLKKVWIMGFTQKSRPNISNFVVMCGRFQWID